MRKLLLLALFLYLASFSAVTFGQTPGTVRFPTALDGDISLIEVKDRATTTLGSTITSGSTTWTVVSTTLFPATGILTIDDERVYYTAKTSTTFTVVRGQFGSTAAAHSAGATIRMNIVARHHEALRDAIVQVETKLGYSSSTPTTAGHVLTVTGAGTTAWAAPSVASILPVADTQTIIKGSADATKLIRFEADGITTGTTRVITAPDADTILPIFGQIIMFAGPTAARTVTLPDSAFTVVGLATTQSLTNKTIAGSTNTITPIDTNFTVTGSADATKIVRFEVDGLTTGTTRVVTFPDANIVAAGSAAALTSGRVPYVATGGLLMDVAGFLFQTSTPNFTITAQGAAHVPLLVKGAASQSANLAEWQNSAGTVLASFDLTGRLRVASATDDAALILISQSTANKGFRLGVTASGASLVGVDATGYGSFQPLSLGGSALSFQISGNEILSASATTLNIVNAINISTGTTTGSIIATTTAQKLGFHAATPTIQRAGAAQAAVATTGATNVAPYGFTTAAQADAIVTLVNELRAALVEKGLIKGAP